MRVGGLALPGDRSAPSIRPSRALLAAATGFLWFPLQATVLPYLGLDHLPLDPILPLVAAFSLGGRQTEAWMIALGLGYLADFFTGVASGRLVLQYALVVLLAAPMHGRVVLRDRLLPVVGVFLLTLFSGLLVLGLLGAMGAVGSREPSRLLVEALGTAGAAWLLWPLYRRIAGWQDGRVQVGRP